LIIHNPVAGQRTAQLVHAVAAALDRQGGQVSLRATTRAGEAEDIARAEQGRHDVIAVAGGDGTVMEVVNGLDHGSGQVDGHHSGWDSQRGGAGTGLAGGP
jgi:diacylglycerol kinase family enzyme